MAGGAGSRHYKLIATRGQLIAQYCTREVLPGSSFYGIETIATEPTHAKRPEQPMRTILRGLCVTDKVADAVAYLPLQSIE